MKDSLLNCWHFAFSSLYTSVVVLSLFMQEHSFTSSQSLHKSRCYVLKYGLRKIRVKAWFNTYYSVAPVGEPLCPKLSTALKRTCIVPLRKHFSSSSSSVLVVVVIIKTTTKTIIIFSNYLPPVHGRWHPGKKQKQEN